MPGGVAGEQLYLAAPYADLRLPGRWRWNRLWPHGHSTRCTETEWAKFTGVYLNV